MTQNKGSVSAILYYLSICVAALMIVAGGMLLYAYYGMRGHHQSNTLVFGAIFVFYGIYRIVRLILKRRFNNRNNVQS